jgi:hypothetical protein
VWTFGEAFLRAPGAPFEGAPDEWLRRKLGAEVPARLEQLDASLPSDSGILVLVPAEAADTEGLLRRMFARRAFRAVSDLRALPAERRGLRDPYVVTVTPGAALPGAELVATIATASRPVSSAPKNRSRFDSVLHGSLRAS